MVILPRKHSHRVMKDVASALHTLIQPSSSMSLLVNWDREGLTTTVIHRIDYGNVELLGVLRKVVSTRHSYPRVSDQTTQHNNINNIPAAPAPTTSTFFFPSLLFPFVAAILEVGNMGSVSRESRMPALKPVRLLGHAQPSICLQQIRHDH
jgi:hypothetical protein